MDIIEKLEILKQGEELLNLLNLRVTCFGNSIYLLNNDVWKTTLFLMNITDSYYGTRFNGYFDGNSIDIFIRESSKRIIIKNFSNTITINKETIDKKNMVVLEMEKLINGQKHTNYILISDSSIEYNFDLDNSKIKLYLNSQIKERLRYQEKKDSSHFDFSIKELSKNEISISASNLPYFNICYIKKNKKVDYYQKVFFNNSHIKEIVELLEEEMMRYIPNLKQLLNRFSLYKNIKTISNNGLFKNDDQLLIDNSVYDGKAIKTLKLK